MTRWTYSIDLRKRAVALWETGGLSEPDVAAVMGIGEASLRRWKRRKREEGSVAPRPHGGGPEPRVLPEHEAIVRRLVEEHPDAYVEDLAIRFVEETGRACSKATMGRVLRRLKLTRKKSRS
jgi:transposase